MDHKEGWLPKNWYFLTVVLEKTLERPLGSKEVKPVNPKGIQPWIFIGRTDDETEAPLFRPSDSKSQLIRKDPNAGRDWRQDEKEVAEMRWLDGITDSMDMSEQTVRDSEGQGSLMCYSPWSHRVGHDWATEQPQKRHDS